MYFKIVVSRTSNQWRGSRQAWSIAVVNQALVLIFSDL